MPGYQAVIQKIKIPGTPRFIVGLLYIGFLYMGICIGNANVSERAVNYAKVMARSLTFAFPIQQTHTEVWGTVE